MKERKKNRWIEEIEEAKRLTSTSYIISIDE